MKIQKLMLAAAASLLVLASCNAQNKNEEKKPMIDSKTIVLENIHNRKSVRNFVPRKMVSKDDLQTLVKAGMAAPSAMNRQPWAFIAVSEKSTLDALSQKMPQQKMLTTCGATILVCADTTRADNVGFWVEDCSAATQNILLAVESMGLGAVWTGAYPAANRAKDLQAAFDLPENIIPVSFIIIGYPEGDTKAKDKWKQENLHWEKW